MSEDNNITSEELDKFFELENRIKSRVRQVAEICTNISSYEAIEKVYEDDDDICIRVWSRSYGHYHYEFPRQYLFMTDAEIKRLEEEAGRV